MTGPSSQSDRRAVRFGDVARLVSERLSGGDEVRRYVGLDDLSTDDLKLRSWGDVRDGTSFTSLFEPGHVLFAKRRAYQRKVSVAQFRGVCSSDVYVFEADRKRLLPELLPHICLSGSFIDHAVKTSAGSLSPRTNWRSLSEFELELPPIAKQLQLVRLLGAAGSLVSRLKDLEVETAKARKALSADRFGRLFAPSGGELIRFGDVVEQVDDRGHEGLPILSVTVDGRIVRREELGRHVSDDTGDRKYLRVEPGQLAYNTMRLWQGSVGVAEEEGLVSSAYTVVRVVNAELSPRFVLELMRSPAMQRVYRRYVTGVASDRWRLYMRDLQNIMLRLPSPARAVETTEALERFDRVQDELRGRIESAVSLHSALCREALGL